MDVVLRAGAVGGRRWVFPVPAYVQRAGRSGVRYEGCGAVTLIAGKLTINRVLAKRKYPP